MATPLSLFTDRRPMRQIGGLRAYLRQVSWSLWWHLVNRRSRGKRREKAPAPSRPPERPVGQG